MGSVPDFGGAHLYQLTSSLTVVNRMEYDRESKISFQNSSDKL